MKNLCKKIILISICFIQLILIVNPVFALKEEDLGKTSYQWSDYSDKPAEFWVELYNIMNGKIDQIIDNWNYQDGAIIYADEYNLLALAYNNFDKIDQKVKDELKDEYEIDTDDDFGNFEIQYGLERVYEDIFDAIVDGNKRCVYKENENSNIVRTISNTIKKKEYRFELLDKMYWGLKLAQTYKNHVVNEEKLTSSQKYAVDYLKSLVDSNYNFPSFSEAEKEAIAREYKGVPRIDSIKDYVLDLHQKIYGKDGEKDPDIEDERNDNDKDKPKPSEGGLPIGYENGEVTTTIDPNKFTPNISDSNPGDATRIVGNILGAINVIGSVIAVVCILIVGMKYMVASVEQKAEYKKMLWPMLVGAMLIFGIILILNILYNIVPSNVDV